MNHYEQKQEARRERLLNRADKLRGESARRFDAARAQIAGIPPGQPILVGHHSEKRHRRDLARHDSHMRAGIDASEAAQEAERRAEGVGTAGISSDDPDAPDKIKERILKLEVKQAQMVLINRYLKKGDDASILAIGIDEKSLALLKTPDFCGRTGFPAYAISNNGANLRRLRLRLIQVEALATRQTIETPVGNGIRIVENVEANRLQIFFPGKPDATVRSELKRSGFRWSPTEGAWQRHLSDQAKWAAGRITDRER